MNRGTGHGTLGTRSHEAAGIREAARALLSAPVLTAARHPETIALIRRHVTALRSMFNTQLGYHLIVESGFARLVKLPPEPCAPARTLVRRSGAPLGASTYTLIALACAALLAPGVGEQILISQLVAQIRADAAEQGISIPDDLPQRRRLVAALSVLIDWGVLTETDGTVADWSDTGTDEALLTILRPLLPHLLVRSIGPGSTDHSILAPEAGAPRRRLRRRLAEEPVVLRRDLSPAELDVLSRERTELSRLLNDNFGLVLEVRAEGALAYDPAETLSDIEFPGAGSVKQAGLLLLGALTDWQEQSSPEPEFTWAVVETCLVDLLDRHRKVWKSEYGDAPERLRDDVIALLVSLRLIEISKSGIRLLGPAFRYRPRPVTRSGQLTLDSVDGEGERS
ncbi:TIGR02678 family protein [Nocardia rhamnosiphila]